jgi:FkbM family methyltransferase
MTLHSDSGKLFRQICGADSPGKLWEVADFAAARHLLFQPAPAEIMQAAQSIVLYGAGRFAEAVIDAWKKVGRCPDYCVDSDSRKWGTRLRGVPVLSPQVLNDYGNSPPLVVIAAMSTHDIENALEEKGIAFLFAERDGSVGYLSGHWLLEHRLDFERVYSALADDLSRKVMLEMAKARLFQRYHFPMRGNFFSAEVATLPQYFAEDIITFARDEIFVDCGAFDGDTLVAFSALMCRHGGDRSWQAVAFEADSGNAKRVARTIANYGIEKIRLVNAAVGGENELTAAASYHNCQGNVGSGVEVQVVTLDDALKGIRPTFIKMDIEGSELAALSGARQTISTHYPKLAICIYHSTSDLLEIPLFILENFPGYKLHMRHHSPGTLWETVCYAVPA